MTAAAGTAAMAAATRMGDGDRQWARVAEAAVAATAATATAATAAKQPQQSEGINDGVNNGVSGDGR